MDRGLYIAECVYKVDKAGGELYRAKKHPDVDIRETRTISRSTCLVSSFLCSVYG